VTEGQAASAHGSDPRPKARVLVVDDVEDNRDLLTRRLRRKGFEAVAAADGPTALRLVDEQDFDVVILDWMMPGMNGLEVLEAIRRSLGKTELPVLMATAKTESDAVVEALNLGANDYVSKPIDFPILVARIEAQLSMREEAAKARTAVIDLRGGIPPGTVVDGRFELMEKVGEGGFAAVYRARQLSTGKDVAFKLMLPHRARRKTGDVELARFLREMRVIADIDHAHVVRLVDSGTIDIAHEDYGEPPRSGSDELPTVAERGISGTQWSSDVTEGGAQGAVPYIVMEFLDGQPLSRVIEDEQPMGVETVANFAIPMLCALGVAHGKGIVHRDVKPHNVLMVVDHQGNREPKVLDFGIAKLTEPGSDELTKSDSFIGTPEYMAPEQGRGKKNIDGRADQFSVAAIMYHALTGFRLYAEESFLAMIHAVAAAAFETPKARGCKLPSDFEAVLLQALSRKREDRFEDSYAFARALMPFASGRIQRRYADELAAGVEPATNAPSEAAELATTDRPPPPGGVESNDSTDTIESELPEPAESNAQSSTYAMNSQELEEKLKHESLDEEHSLREGSDTLESARPASELPPTTKPDRRGSASQAGPTGHGSEDEPAASRVPAMVAVMITVAIIVVALLSR
jgi:eukaryotic-like serine/threonine-protein kinase